MSATMFLMSDASFYFQIEQNYDRIMPANEFENGG